LEAAYKQLLRTAGVDIQLLSDCAEIQKSYNSTVDLNCLSSLITCSGGRTYQRCDANGAYNVVLTSNYLFLAPRSKLKFSDDGVNGLGKSLLLSESSWLALFQAS
jgi:ATP adenylyltransferase/5',5'''-P-1,P-4-tetraphosphate phosphorylase II